VLVQRAFQQTQNEVRGVVHAARLRVLADLDAREEHEVPRAIAQAARLVTVGAALRAARRSGGDKLRVLWRLCSTTLTVTVTVADNGEELAGGESSAMLARRIGGLGAEIELDSKPYWGTTLTCRLPLHDSPAWPETPAVRRLAELRERELEVLELMIAGLRNRDIADRLFISVRTVKFHVSNVLRKLEVDSRPRRSRSRTGPASPHPPPWKPTRRRRRGPLQPAQWRPRSAELHEHLAACPPRAAGRGDCSRRGVRRRSAVRPLRLLRVHLQVQQSGHGGHRGLARELDTFGAASEKPNGDHPARPRSAGRITRWNAPPCVGRPEQQYAPAEAVALPRCAVQARWPR
jgi:DNA-binding CsgD family transcriptional regulator